MVLVCATLPLLAQTPDLEPVTVTRGIDARDVEAIRAAGASGNRDFVPTLRAVAGKPRFDGNLLLTPGDQARLALARLGEQRELQEFWCEATGPHLQPPVELFKLIGGWYGFRALREVLNGAGEENFHRAVTKSRTGDVVHVRPVYLALEVLSRIVPEPPAEEPSERRYREQVRIWLDWLAEHEPELRHLQPTGDGVDFMDAACKNGKPVKRGR